MLDILRTKSDIFESTPKVSRERNLHFNIPLGLSPPDFSAMKMHKQLNENVENHDHPERPMATLDVFFKEVPQLLMSPFLNLSTPRKFGMEDKANT